MNMKQVVLLGYCTLLCTCVCGCGLAVCVCYLPMLFVLHVHSCIVVEREDKYNISTAVCVITQSTHWSVKAQITETRLIELAF